MQEEETLAFAPAGAGAGEDPPAVLRERAAEAGITMNGDAPWDIQVLDARLYRRMLTQGSLGLGEAYLDGMWECERLDQLFDRLPRIDAEEKLGRWARVRLFGEMLRHSLFNLKNSAPWLVYGWRTSDGKFTAVDGRKYPAELAEPIGFPPAEDGGGRRTPSAPGGGASGAALVGVMDGVHIDLLHLQHGPHRALAAVGTGVADPFGERARYHLPRQPEFILEPAALLRLLVSAGGELRPVKIDLLLVLAQHLKRNGFVELEDGSAVERGEDLALDFEFDEHHRPLGPPVYLEFLLAVAGGAQDA